MKAEFNALAESTSLTPEAFEQLTLLRQQTWRSEDFQEGLDAFHARRPPDFTGR